MPLYAAGPATDSTTAPAPDALAITNSAWQSASRAGILSGLECRGQSRGLPWKLTETYLFMERLDLGERGIP